MYLGAAATGWTGPFAPRGGRRDWPLRRTKCHHRKSSDGLRKWSPCWRGRGSGRRRWNGTSRASLPSSLRRRKHRRASQPLQRRRREQRKRRRPEPWMLRRAAWPSREQAPLSSARPGPSREDFMWGATTGGGTDSDASRPSHATDVQLLNGMQESGAIDHFYAQEQRRRQQPQVFRIDTTESEGEPQVQPQQQIRARPVRRPRA